MANKLIMMIWEGWGSDRARTSPSITKENKKIYLKRQSTFKSHLLKASIKKRFTEANRIEPHMTAAFLHFDHSCQFLPGPAASLSCRDLMLAMNCTGLNNMLGWRAEPHSQGSPREGSWGQLPPAVLPFPTILICPSKRTPKTEAMMTNLVLGTLLQNFLMQKSLGPLPNTDPPKTPPPKILEQWPRMSLRWCIWH